MSRPDELRQLRQIIQHGRRAARTVIWNLRSAGGGAGARLASMRELGAIFAGSRVEVTVDGQPRSLTVAAGGRHVPAQARQRLANRDAGPRLSRRELDILRAVADGKTNAQVGAALGITAGTVRIHMTSILMKLGARRLSRRSPRGRAQRSRNLPAIRPG